MAPAINPFQQYVPGFFSVMPQTVAGSTDVKTNLQILAIQKSLIAANPLPSLKNRLLLGFTLDVKQFYENVACI